MLCSFLLSYVVWCCFLSRCVFLYYLMSFYDTLCLLLVFCYIIFYAIFYALLEMLLLCMDMGETILWHTYRAWSRFLRVWLSCHIHTIYDIYDYISNIVMKILWIRLKLPIIFIVIIIYHLFFIIMLYFWLIRIFFIIIIINNNSSINNTHGNIIISTFIIMLLL